MLQSARSRSFLAFIRGNVGLLLTMIAVVFMALSGQSFAAGEGELSAESFTSVGTKILTYLGFAIAAGLLVMGATVAAQAGWRFFAKFLK